jgi:uncharacterized membrane protein
MKQTDEQSKIIFEDERSQRSFQSFKTPTLKIIRWIMVISCGTIKSEKQANFILICFVVVAITLSLFLVYKSIRNDNVEPLSNDQIEQIINNQRDVQQPK